MPSSVAQSEAEYREFSRGHAMGEPCGRELAETVKEELLAMGWQEREAAQSDPAYFNRWIARAFKGECERMAKASPFPQVFMDGWFAGFKSGVDERLPLF